MKANMLALSSVACLLTAGTADAGFLHIEIKNMNHWFGVDINLGGGNIQTAFNAADLDSWRVYAVFDSPGAVLGTIGRPNKEMYLENADNGTFFNYTETQKGGGTTHFDVAPDAPFVMTPSKAYDTFATIGGFPGPVDDTTQFTPPGSGSDNGGVGNHFQTNWSSNEGPAGRFGWFQDDPVEATQNPNGLFSPNSPHGFETDGRYYVCLFQMTVEEGKKLNGRMGVILADGTKINHERRNSFTTNVPSPTSGALALLGLGGFVGRRRHREA